MAVAANLEPQAARTKDSFWAANRQAFRELAAHLALEHPESLIDLQEVYLEPQPGYCSLPAAYTIAYGRLFNRSFADWIERLDSRLAENGLVGDRRVNWLLARAMAEEARVSGAKRWSPLPEQVGAGRPWLQEALLVCETPAVRKRVLAELLSRLLVLRKYRQADELIQQAEEPLSAWQEAVAEFREWSEKQARQRAERSRESHVAELRRRLASAEARGDDAMAARYKRLIQQASEVNP